MLNRDVFIAGLAHLEGYYKRSIDEFPRLVWYKHLSQNLTTQEFQQAIEAAIIHKQFMPTPAELVELVRGNDRQLAAEEWELCLKAASRGTAEGLDVSEAARRALQSIGGISGLGRATEEQTTWLRKEFIDQWKAYRQVPKPTALPTAEPWGALPALDVTLPISDIGKNMNGKGTRHERN